MNKQANIYIKFNNIELERAKGIYCKEYLLKDLISLIKINNNDGKRNLLKPI